MQTMAIFAKFAILAFVAVAVSALPAPAANPEPETADKAPDAEPDAELVKVQNGKIAPKSAEEEDETLKTANSYGFGYGFPGAHYAGAGAAAYTPYYGGYGYPYGGYGYGYPYYGYNHFYGGYPGAYGFHGAFYG